MDQMNTGMGVRKDLLLAFALVPVCPCACGLVECPGARLPKQTISANVAISNQEACFAYPPRTLVYATQNKTTGHWLTHALMPCLVVRCFACSFMCCRALMRVKFHRRRFGFNYCQFLDVGLFFFHRDVDTVPSCFPFFPWFFFAFVPMGWLYARVPLDSLWAWCSRARVNSVNRPDYLIQCVRMCAAHRCQTASAWRMPVKQLGPIDYCARRLARRLKVEVKVILHCPFWFSPLSTLVSRSHR